MSPDPSRETTRGRGSRWTALALFGAVAVILFLVSQEFMAMWEDPPIYPGQGVTGQARLSDYYPGIEDTWADTDVYFLEGAAPGGTALILGGTHPNEPASSLTAITMLENAVVRQGRLIVVPRAAHSGFTATDPQEGFPQVYHIEMPTGTREFRYGGRGTNPVHQWPDPVIYVNGSGQQLAGPEVRNLNRSYPGDPEGYLTERLAYAIVELIRQEEIDLSIDLHEASPEYPVINAMVAHENAVDLAVEAALLLEFEGLQIGVEPSPANLRGLSHREWGDATGTKAILIESANPAQGRLRGSTNEALIVEGVDRYYNRAGEMGLLYVPFGDEGSPMEERVGRHIQTVSKLLEVFSTYNPERTIAVDDLPTFNEVLQNGLGAYLAHPEG
ncbi:MAG: succinylglutamate desuccinylase [Gemmatimonadetes bacterium]|nr:succinylglutamate desuccinylase [Gemmatimonadota bacterium]NNM06094.1 succinylglutamate desuccinylase [Gemmatimonadota bacterium]